MTAQVMTMRALRPVATNQTILATMLSWVGPSLLKKIWARDGVSTVWIGLNQFVLLRAWNIIYFIVKSNKALQTP